MSGRLTIALLFPLLTSGQGDEGNATVLRHRGRLRGIETDIVVHHEGTVAPAQIYLLGGLESDTMPTLVERLRDSGFPDVQADRHAVVLAVDAGFQVLGRSFMLRDGSRHEGLGLLDIRAEWMPQLRSGPVIGRVGARWGGTPLSAYESHHSVVELGEGVEPFAYLELGLGNEDATGASGPRPDGATTGNIIGTSLHGPLLARNADLADRLLEAALGRPIEPAPAALSDALRSQRIEEDLADPTGWGGRVYGRPQRRRRSRPPRERR